MIEINGKELRSMYEQIQWNLDQIQDLKTRENLGNLGIRVVDIEPLADSSMLPPDYQGEYGDAYLVGTETPYDLWIWTRGDKWFNFGPLNAPSLVPGPAGPQGEQGIPGEAGAMWYVGYHAPILDKPYNVGDMYLDSTVGNVYRYEVGGWDPVGSIRGPQGIQGIQGPQGIQGIQGLVGATGAQGEPGKPFTIAGILATSNLLPTPSQELQNEAYLVGSDENFDMYVIVGENDDYMWVNLGKVTAIEGPQGPQGEVGPQGATGPQGEAGHPIYYVAYSSSSSIPLVQLTPSTPQAVVNDLLVTSDGKLCRITSISYNNIVSVTVLASLVGPAGFNPQYIELSGTYGTLSSSQMSILQANDLNYIKMGYAVFNYSTTVVASNGTNYRIYSRLEYNPTNSTHTAYDIYITHTSLSWQLVSKPIRQVTANSGSAQTVTSIGPVTPSSYEYSTGYNIKLSNVNYDDVYHIWNIDIQNYNSISSKFPQGAEFMLFDQYQFPVFRGVVNEMGYCYGFPVGNVPNIYDTYRMTYPYAVNYASISYVSSLTQS